MSGLGLFLEAEGIATVSISLVREHTERMRPPRALWVPFPLGRPFGAADNAAFQKRVLLSTLQLLERDRGPVLEDFPDDAPHTDTHDEPIGWVCPVNFSRPTDEAPSIQHAVLDEIRALEPWYETAVAKRQRTTVGLAGLSAVDCAAFLAAATRGESPALPRSTDSLPDALRWAAEDLKAWYFEAATAQSLGAAQADLEDWFWRETRAGELLKTLRRVCLDSEEAAVHDVGDFMLIADGYVD